MKSFFYTLILSIVVFSASCFGNQDWKLIVDKTGVSIFSSKLEYDLFYDVIRDIEQHKLLNSLTNSDAKKCGVKQSVYNGHIFHEKQKFDYTASNGQIDVWNDTQYFTFSAENIFESLSKSIYSQSIRESKFGFSDDENETPAWGHLIVPVVVVLANHIACSESAASAVAYCNRVCNCGVQSYTYSCIAGSINASCSCTPCPQTPNLISSFPVYGSWSGPLIHGLPMLFNPGSALVIGQPYTSAQ